jgi:hypothetical protein
MEREAANASVHRHSCSNSAQSGVRLKAKAKSKSRASGRRPDARLTQTGKLLLQRNLEKQIKRREQKPKQRWEEPDEPARTPPVLLAIVGANCVVFVLWQSTSIRRFMGKHFALSSAGVLKEGRFHTLITSIFSHYDPVHLGANMCCLIFFGKEVVAILGRARFAALFVASGLVSSMAQVAWPLVAPPQSRYSQYQLGLGARSVCLCELLPSCCFLAAAQALFPAAVSRPPVCFFLAAVRVITCLVDCEETDTLCFCSATLLLLVAQCLCKRSSRGLLTRGSGAAAR